MPSSPVCVCVCVCVCVQCVCVCVCVQCVCVCARARAHTHTHTAGRLFNSYLYTCMSVLRVQVGVREWVCRCGCVGAGVRGLGGQGSEGMSE
jgi:hypothetical protein